MNANLRALPPGQMLSDYRIEGILGQGGFGITYLAIDTMLNRRVAIKEFYPRQFAVRDGTLTVRPAGSQDDRDTFKWGLERFLDEAQVLARFEEPNIIGIRRFFRANGTAYLVMDYCDGDPLDEIIKRNGPLNQLQLEEILYPLLDGLEKIHEANFLHRDIKPANIFIRADGSPVLLDFGAARQEIGNHSRSVTSLATDGYAPFEQYSEKGRQGPYTDIYGLCATLYTAVTGEKPPPATDRMLDDTMISVSEKAYGRYSVNLLNAIDAGMAIRPNDRPQSVTEFRHILGASKGSPTKAVQAPKNAAPKRNASKGKNFQPPKIQDKSKNVILIVVGVISTLVVGIYLLNKSSSQPKLNEFAENPVPVTIPSASNSLSQAVVSDISGSWTLQGKSCAEFKLSIIPDATAIGYEELTYDSQKSVKWMIISADKIDTDIFKIVGKSNDGSVIEDGYKLLNANEMQLIRKVILSPNKKALALNGKWLDDEKPTPLMVRCP